MLDSSPTGEESHTTFSDPPLGMPISSVTYVAHSIFLPQRVASSRVLVDSSSIPNTPLGSVDKSAVTGQSIVRPATLHVLPPSTATAGANGSVVPPGLSNGTNMLIEVNNSASKPIGLCRPRGIGLHGFLRIFCNAHSANTELI